MLPPGLEYFATVLALSFALQGAAVPTGTKTAATPATAAIQEVERVLLREVSEANLAERQLGTSPPNGRPTGMCAPSPNAWWRITVRQTRS